MSTCIRKKHSEHYYDLNLYEWKFKCERKMETSQRDNNGTKLAENSYINLKNNYFININQGTKTLNVKMENNFITRK